MKNNKKIAESIVTLINYQRQQNDYGNEIFHKKMNVLWNIALSEPIIIHIISDKKLQNSLINWLMNNWTNDVSLLYFEIVKKILCHFPFEKKELILILSRIERNIDFFCVDLLEDIIKKIISLGLSSVNYKHLNVIKKLLAVYKQKHKQRLKNFLNSPSTYNYSSENGIGRH